MKNIKELKQQLQKGKKFNYLFFWGHRQKTEGIIDKSCFSQWFPIGFTIDEVYYKTAEHYMMAEKARIFDVSMVENILNASSPNDVKKLGRKVKNFDDKIWNEQAFDAVVRGNMAKFSQNHKLKNFLRSTGNSVLVESSPYDRVWGIGMLAEDKRALNPFNWDGENKLGFALMVVRDVME